MHLTDLSMKSRGPRGLASTILMTVIGSTFAGFLWIGRPRLEINEWKGFSPKDPFELIAAYPSGA